MRPIDIGQRFEIAGGSVAGPAHARGGRNNQDAACWAASPAGLIAVVCDGCSGGARSEVGAQLGARLLVRAGLERLQDGLDADAFVAAIERDVLARLDDLAEALALVRAPSEVVTARADAVADYLLFTVVGVVITESYAATFALGDGVIAVNGERDQLGPFADNRPPYLGYALLPGAPPRLRVHRRIATEELESLLLGSDGVLDLEGGLEGERHGGEPRSPLESFWRDDRVFRNPDQVRRQLTVLGRGEAGVRLTDDTTLVVVRRRVAEEA